MVPTRPWVKVTTDIFHLNERRYFVLVDYYSAFIEVDLVDDMRSSTIIRKLKAHFAWYEIPETFVCDNGSQLVSTEFCQLASTWGSKMITSSPEYPQSNMVRQKVLSKSQSSC